MDYFLRHKDEAFNIFKEWKAAVENQTGKQVKALRTDNGLEYRNSKLARLSKESEITKQHIIPGTPQQNGVAERYNKIIFERVRCMLIYSGLSKLFWPAAAHTACYLINRQDYKTPMQMWTNLEFDYASLKVFGVWLTVK